MAAIPIVGASPTAVDAPPPLAERVVARDWMAQHPLAHHPLHAILSPAQMRRLAFYLWCYQQRGMPL